MPEDRKYVRVYYNDMIRDYPEVWADDAQLATWLRLLATADPMWPTPPELPRSVKARALGKLVGATLVATLTGHRYQMKGMEAERGRRSDAGRIAAAKRWHSDSNATGNAEAMPKRAETSKAETSSSAIASDDPFDAPETEALQWLAKHGCSIVPGNGFHRHLITMVEVHGVNAVVGMFDRLAEAGMKQGDTQGFVFGAKDALNARTRPDLHALEREASEERSADRSKRIQAQMWERRLELYRETGQWDEAWGDPPKVPA